ncbi:MAG: hypothetical protein STSR0008_18730 [Ignavibacterium sp.]
MNEKIEHLSISDYLSILSKWKYFLIIILLTTVIFISIISLFITNTYKANSIVMISPESGVGIGGLSSLIGGKSGAESFGSRLLGGSSASEDMIFGILNSRTAITKVINKFNLHEYYQIKDKNIDKTIKAFSADVNFDLTENNFIEISVINKDPEISAQIANYFVFVLDSLNNKISSEAAGNNRKFIENRYLKNLADLKAAEDSLYSFQKKYGIVAVPEQFELAFKASADIEAEYFKRQILSEVTLQQFGENSPQYKTQLIELNILKEKIDQLKNSPNLIESSNIFLPYKQLPDIAIKYLRIYREVEIQSKIFEITLPMYEQAKVEEIKNIPAVIVVDKAKVPQVKYRPQRSFIVLSVSFLLLFLLIPMIFRMETILNKKELKNSFEKSEYKKYLVIKSVFKIKT